MLSPVKTYEQGIIAAMPALRSFAMSMSRNTEKADDLVQETMLRALSNRDSFQQGTNLNAWLFTILKNLFRTGIRRKREVEDPDDTMARNMPFEDSPLKKLEVAEMMRLIDRMPERYRGPLRLIADGASYEEAALELTEQIGTIKSRINRGRAILKAAE